MHFFHVGNRHLEVLTEIFKGCVAEQHLDLDGMSAIVEHMSGAGPTEAVGRDRSFQLGLGRVALYQLQNSFTAYRGAFLAEPEALLIRITA